MGTSVCAEHVQPQIKSVLVAITQDQVQLPSLPDLVVHIRDEINSPKSTAQSIAKLVARDPALSANILRYANSPLYGSISSVRTLPLAVQRLGLHLVHSLTLATIARQLFHASSAWTATQLNRVWSHSVRTAALSSVLAPRFKVDSDVALLAGLLHDMGSFVMLVHLEGTPDLFVNEDRLDCLLYATRVEAGLALASHWNLPSEVVDTIKTHNEMSKGGVMQAPSAPELVRAASWFLTDACLRGDVVVRQRENALGRLGFAPDEDLLADPAVLDKVDAIVQLLRG